MTGSLLSGGLVGMALLSAPPGSAAPLVCWGVLCTAVLSRRRSRGLNRTTRWSLYLALAAGLIAALWYGLAALVARYAWEGLESSGRWELWRLMLSELPLRQWLAGVGLGGFEAIFKTVQSAELRFWYDHAHNDLLEWLLEMGIVGALALGGAAWALQRRAHNDAYRAPLYGALIAIALIGLDDFSWHVAGTQLVIACALGTVLRPTSNCLHRRVDWEAQLRPAAQRR